MRDNDSRHVTRIIHLVPYDGIGGVETAARTMAEIAESDLHFTVEYLADNGREHAAPPALNLLVIWRAVLSLLRKDPDLWITSLWRSSMVGIVIKLVRPRRKFVLFLHAPRSVHWVDAIVTRLAAGLADEIWADSAQTLLQRLPGRVGRRGRVISFLTEHRSPLPVAHVRPSFIFWGRVAPEKQLERALRIFAAVYRQEPAARFQVIGPDGGDLERTKSLAAGLSIHHAVSFLGARNFQDILPRAAESSFYLQTSSFEGMALSVVEAMQLGLVPVVTPVGEIERYCRGGVNAIVVSSDARAAQEILSLLQSNDAYHRMRTSAIKTWSKEPLYRTSVLQSCRDLLGGRRVDLEGTAR